jgi:broad specificity phosphatase PhoE
MSRLFLVRHAETRHNQRKVLQGAASAPSILSGHGEAQARACGLALAALALPEPRVYASTYRRAEQTAEAIATALSTGVTVLDGLQEMDVGSWGGRPYSALEVGADGIRHGDGTFGFVGGESEAQVRARLRIALATAFARGGTPIVVSHGLALQAALCDLLGVPFDDAWADQRYAHANTAITELEGGAGGWRAVRVADTEHLHTLA